MRGPVGRLDALHVDVRDKRDKRDTAGHGVAATLQPDATSATRRDKIMVLGGIVRRGCRAALRSRKATLTRHVVDVAAEVRVASARFWR